MTPIDRQHLNATLDALVRNVKSHYDGSHHTYRMVAASLRTLLCDYRRAKDVSLLPRCFSDVRLPRILGSMEPGVAFSFPGTAYFDGKGGSTIEALFRPNFAEGGLPLDEWLTQKIIDPQTNLKEFIRSVADKEGAHADADRGPILEKSHSVFLASRVLTTQYIVAIADLVADYIAARHILKTGRAAEAAITGLKERGKGAVVVGVYDFCVQGLDRFEVPYRTEKELGTSLDYDPSSMFVLGRVALHGRRTNFTRVKAA